MANKQVFPKYSPSSHNLVKRWDILSNVDEKSPMFGKGPEKSPATTSIYTTRSSQRDRKLWANVIRTDTKSQKRQKSKRSHLGIYLTHQTIRCLIIGAGPAGLTCASNLGRLLYTSIVFSSPSLSSYRNAKSSHMHGVLTWEHQDAAKFRAAARKDLHAHYDTIHFRDSAVRTIEKVSHGVEKTLFKAVDEEGMVWWGRKVALAMGVEDVMPDIKGYEECWVSGIFHCLFCHGYEERGAASAGILAIEDCANAGFALHIATFANRLAKKITIYTNSVDAVTDEIETALGMYSPESKMRMNVAVEKRKVVELVKLPERAQVEVVLEDGSRHIEGFLAHKPKGIVRGDFVRQLGLDLTEQGMIEADAPFNETSMKGVFAGGDCASMVQSAALALGSGAMMVPGIAGQLRSED